jgi:superfamily II DNA or RNA helicase
VELATGSVFGDWSLRGSLRPSQQLALNAFEADRAAGRTSTHVVAPPGSGKTVVGLEMIRRLGQPALVLAPTTPIASQWAEKLALFCDHPAAYLGPSGALHVLTYQSLCQTADPGGALRDAAREHLIAQRASATGQDVESTRTEVARMSGTAEKHFERDLATEIARLKRSVARGDDLGVELDALVSPAARERIAALRRTGVRTIVLDECHHLASLWGYLVRVVVAELGQVHVIGLTATSPTELTGEEAALYTELLGPVDFEIPTPAVVRDGALAPYQELAFFTEPLQSELQWLEERHVRFAELLDRLHDPPGPDDEDIAFAPWVIARMRYRDTADGAARVPFSTLAAQRPELARAGLRYLSDAGLELPDDAPRGEGWREPPTLDDWLVLIGDYAVGCLRAHPGDAAERRFDELQRGLRDLGFTLTRQGVRRGGSDVDRVLTASAAKPLAAIEVIAAEADARGDELRGVVLCDAEHGERQPEGSPLSLAGGARGVMSAFAGDDRTAALAPLLVTGQTIACLPVHAEMLARALGATQTNADEGFTVLSAPGWDSAAWVTAAGRAFEAGATQLLIGTRGLLGEGWDSPSVNVLVDLTAVAADVSVRQMRGRSLRLDPSDADKLASNWDVVCVAPALARGIADYARFVRRHTHLRAPCEDGSIEAGVSHVHASLSPYLPPASDAITGLNRDAVTRAADRSGARQRWRIGEPYVGEDVPVLFVRRQVGHGRDDDREPTAPDTGLLLSTAPSVPRPGGFTAAFRLRALKRAYPPTLPLDRVARAIVAAYVSLGEVRPSAAASLSLTPRPGGIVRCALSAGNAAENAQLTASLDEALSPGAGQRYVISRPVWPAGLTPGRARWRALTGRSPLTVAWHAVPSDFANKKERAEAYRAAWCANVGPGELLFAGREAAAGRDQLVAAAAARPDYVTSRRTLWH